MKLTFSTTKNLYEYLLQYEELLKETQGEQARAIFSKAKTALVRYTAPGWGYPVKLEGRLTPAEMMQGLEFLKTITLEQAVNALAIQKTVFERFGPAVSSQSQRVYRSALKQFLKYLRTLPEWPQPRLGKGGSEGQAPYIHGPRAPLGPRYALKISEMTPELQAELAEYSRCCQEVRTPPLAENTLHRYLKDIRNLLGWLYRYKGHSLEELSLFRIVPPEACWQPDAMERVMALCREYVAWLRDERQVAKSTIGFGINTFLLITEYTHYVYDLQKAHV